MAETKTKAVVTAAYFVLLGGLAMLIYFYGLQVFWMTMAGLLVVALFVWVPLNLIWVRR